MRNFLQVAYELPGVAAAGELFEERSDGCVYITGCVESQRVHAAESLRSPGGIHLFITDDERRLPALEADCSFFGAKPYIYPAKDLIFYSADMHGRQISAKRLACINKIIEVKNSEAESVTIVTTIGALTDFLIPLEKYEESIFYINKGDEIDLEKLKSALVNAGYERKDMVRSPGEWSMRGDILDIYSVTEENPVRIELWGDSVDTVREFDASSQRSIVNRERLKVFPATEELFTEAEIEDGIKKVQADYKRRLSELGDNENGKSKEIYEVCNRLTKEISALSRLKCYSKFFSYFEKKTSALYDYLPDGSQITFEDARRVLDKLDELENEFKSGMDYRYKNGYILKKQMDMIRSKGRLLKELAAHRLLLLTGFNVKLSGIKPDFQTHVEASGISAYNNSFDELVTDVKRLKEQGYRVVIAAASRSRVRRLKDELFECGVEAYSASERSPHSGQYAEDLERNKPVSHIKSSGVGTEQGTIQIVEGGMSRGFLYPEIKFALITENDIYTAGHRKRENRKKKKPALEELHISPGDFVVHESYGIGIYRGIVKQTVDNIQKDYIRLDYAAGTSVYILATQTDVIQKYAAADTDAPPKIQKIGSAVWTKTKSRARANAEGVAADLVRLYATRMSMKGYRFGPDTVWQTEFEEMFPYEETLDQLDAIADVKRDMESERCMDRLICGDVGFGKTEVALRAAFKAVQEGKQVAMLAPTTILAGQHFETFSARLRAFPVNVALMSGMCTASQNTKTARDVKTGVTDIVIGTHRILSKDVTFKDLGLLIIDEEQRFGVSQKEKIKKLKENVDVIALSATPIPRTLSMSLAGIRDMSTLEEPPVDRQPIQTFVSETDAGLIKEAITREVNRGGQVYYIYNRVNMLDDVLYKLSELMPEVIFAAAHGQMDKRSLERIMTDFINGEIDVLISTTIVETGLDIPNVNTIIIENADRLGLSQLYQLRGRVGRASRIAYAFLLFSRERVLSEVAEKRLRAISEMTDLGSGYRLAMKDLEIRGAGNFLGKVQSGHMEAVGFELYTKMLNEAVARLKGIEIAESFETTVDFAIEAHLPDNYVSRENHKLELYKRIASIETENDRQQIEDELLDMYGRLPEPALNLLKLALIKALAGKAGITEVRGGKKNGIWLTRAEVRIKDGRAVISDEELERIYEERGFKLIKKEESRVLAKTEPGDIYKDAGEYLDGVTEILSPKSE